MRGTRTGLIVTSGVALGTLTPIALHQLGLIRRLPDPPLEVFDSNSITGSKMAHPFGIPDGLLGMASYGVTLGMAVALPGSPTLKRLVALKVAFDGGFAAVNTVRELVTFRKLCSWCMGTVAASVLSVWVGRRLLREEL